MRQRRIKKRRIADYACVGCKVVTTGKVERIRVDLRVRGNVLFIESEAAAGHNPGAKDLRKNNFGNSRVAIMLRHDVCQESSEVIFPQILRGTKKNFCNRIAFGSNQ